MLYAALIVAVGLVMLFVLETRARMGLSVLHVLAPMFTTTKDGGVRNGYTLRLANKSGEPRKFALEVTGIKDIAIKSEEADVAPDGRLIVSVDPDATQEAQLYVTVPKASLSGPSETIAIKASDLTSGESSVVRDHFFGP